MSKYEFKKSEKSVIETFYAINMKTSDYIKVILWENNETSIEISNGAISKQVLELEFRIKDYVDSTAEEFVAAIGKADSIFHETPFL